MAEPAKILADFAHEEAAIAEGAQIVCGVDEVGRGPLAGPVVAAAVVLDAANLPPDLADSKAMSAKRREAVFEIIIARASAISLVSLPAPVIDSLNIRAASLRAMTLAVRGLAERPDLALIDGNALPEGLPCRGVTIIKGDAKSLSIAAASIVAKVTRDRMMQRAHEVWPPFGLDGHKGYPTATHRETLMEIGPTPIHRHSFAPVRAAVAKSR